MCVLYSPFYVLSAPLCLLVVVCLLSVFTVFYDCVNPLYFRGTCVLYVCHVRSSDVPVLLCALVGRANIIVCTRW